MYKKFGAIINPLTSPGEVVSVFTSPYLSVGAPALGEAKGLIKEMMNKKLLMELIIFEKLFLQYLHLVLSQVQEMHLLV